MPEEKPDITDALNWLASHSGEYSKQIIDAFEALKQKNFMLSKRNDHLMNHAVLSIQSSNLLSHSILVQQVALMDAQINKNPKLAVQWISNELAGPGHLFDIEDAISQGKTAQQYYDENDVDFISSEKAKELVLIELESIK